MRLFRIGLWIVVVAMGCKREEVPTAGALRLDLSYATFRPGCLTVTATDREAPERSETQEVNLGTPPARSRDLTVAVFRKEGWSRKLSVTATAYERSCTASDRRRVDTATVEAEVPEEGTQIVKLDLRAEDLDDDGYVKTSQGGTDCNDDDAAVRPNQTEALCNGVDENCDGALDESFNVGSGCITQLGCEGALACAAGGTTTVCQNPQEGTWYVDDDGDLRAGTVVGVGCNPPVAGAVNRLDDCDDSSPFVFDGGTERCDRLDNNCNGQVDEVGCGTASWKPISGVGATDAQFRAVAAYAEGKAWVVGLDGELAHVSAGVATPYTTVCPGDWLSAWARPSDGRVFLGSDNGLIATLGLTGAPVCPTTTTGSGASINGLVGFENGANTTLFAVTGNGRILRWNYPADASPTAVSDLSGVNLRDVHGTSATNLLAVGFERVSSKDEPRAYRSNPDGGPWLSENLPANLPSDFALRGVHMVHGQLAYAAGDKGVLLERSNGTWTATPPLRLGDGGTPDIQDVAAYGRTAVYVPANDEVVYQFNGTAWVPVYTGTWTPFAIDGVGPHDLWVTGDQGKVIHWAP